MVDRNHNTFEYSVERVSLDVIDLIYQELIPFNHLRYLPTNKHTLIVI